LAVADGGNPRGDGDDKIEGTGDARQGYLLGAESHPRQLTVFM
jgi:hypothetical protein